jgi:hypothetical protein
VLTGIVQPKRKKVIGGASAFMALSKYYWNDQIRRTKGKGATVCMREQEIRDNTDRKT